MGLIDNLRKVGGQIKNRLASAVGALKGAAGRVTISGGRTVRGIRVAARATRLTTPAGIALTAASFAPEIIRGVRTAGRFLQRAIPRGVAFVGGQRVVSGVAGGAGAGAVAGLISRKSGQPPQVQTLDPRSAAERNRDIEKAFKAGRPVTTRRRKKSVKRKRKVTTRRVRKKRKSVRRGKKRTHRSPRHKGHKRVSFVTADGKKVSFLAKKVPPKHSHR